MNRTFLPAIFLMFAAVICGLETAYAQWTPTSGPGHRREKAYVASIVVSGKTLLAATAGSGVFRTSDNGLHWDTSSAGLTNFGVCALAVCDKRVIAGTGSGIFISTDDGRNWAPAFTDEAGKDVRAIIAGGKKLVAGTFNGNILVSVDSGAHWTAHSSVPYNTQLFALASLGMNLFAGTYGGGIFRSTDNGLNWNTLYETLPIGIYSLAVLDADIFAGTSGGGIFRSTDNGENWTLVSSGLTNGSVRALKSAGNTLFAGTHGGVFSSHDRGASWVDISEGLSARVISSLGVSDSNMFCADDSGLVWRRPLAEITSLDLLSAGLSSHYSIEQNYPNPFNPTTTIGFSIPQSGFVSLRIFNVFGANVGALVSEELRPGTYKTNWNAAGFPSGVYFYTVSAGNFTETKRMVLLK